MFESKWYEFKINNNIIIGRYKLSNRIKALLTFSLLLCIYVYFKYIWKENINLIVEIIYLLFSFYFLYMGVLVDKYTFNNNKKVLVIEKGFLVSFIKREINYENIEEVSIIEHKIGYKKKEMYEFSIFFKDWKKVKFGIFRDKKLLEDVKKNIKI